MNIPSDIKRIDYCQHDSFLFLFSRLFSSQCSDIYSLQEIMYMSFDKIRVDYSHSNIDTKIELQIGSLQVHDLHIAHLCRSTIRFPWLRFLSSSAKQQRIIKRLFTWAWWKRTNVSINSVIAYGYGHQDRLLPVLLGSSSRNGFQCRRRVPHSIIERHLWCAEDHEKFARWRRCRCESSRCRHVR